MLPSCQSRSRVSQITDKKVKRKNETNSLQQDVYIHYYQATRQSILPLSNVI